MTTRAIHIDTVLFMDTKIYRSTSSTIWYNNGANYLTAEKKLLNCFQSWNAEAPAERAKKGIKWELNPPMVHENVSFVAVKKFSTQ